MVICLERGAELHIAQRTPLPLAVSCFSKIQIGFTFLVPARLGCPGKGPLNGCCCCCYHKIRTVGLRLSLTAADAQFDGDGGLVRVCRRRVAGAGRGVHAALVVSGARVVARVARSNAANCQTTIEIRQSRRVVVAVAAAAHWSSVCPLPDDPLRPAAARSQMNQQQICSAS